MQRKIILLLLIFSSHFLMHSLANDKNNFGINFGGIVKNDFFYDSRQGVCAREGHFLLWPAMPLLDPQNEDINAVSSFNFLAIQTRLNATVSAPKAFGVKTSGHVEGAFFGHSNADINGFRLRHAFVKFNWENSELLFGQYWNPFFITSSFPDVVSFNTGCPFQPFSRNPQIRLTHTVGNIKIIAAALSQRDFASIGPAGTSSSYLRNSALPDMHFQAHYTFDPGGEIQFIIGGGAAYKEIVPELATGQGYKTDAAVAGISYMGFVKVKLRPVTIKSQYFRGQNANDLLMPGGYGISRVTDIEKGTVEYSPIQYSALWVDLHTNGPSLQFGLFCGVSENLGAVNNLVEGTNVTGLGTNIRSLYRVSPRIVLNSGKTRFALEGEYTGARFGSVNTSENRRGIPLDPEEVNNLRLLLGVYMFF